MPHGDSGSTENPNLHIDVLVDLGLTHLQAKIYLSLLRLDREKAQTISRTVGIDRSNTYKVIAELQRMGLVEKILGKPSTYRAKQLREGISNLLTDYREKSDAITKEAEELLNTANAKYESSDKRVGEYYISVTSGLKAGCRGYSKDIERVQKSYDYLCIDWRRVVPWFDKFREQFLRALSRGVKMRCIAQIPIGEKMPPAVRAFLDTGFFVIRSVPTVAHAGIDIWDREKIHIIIYPELGPNWVEAIESSNPALVELAQDFFDIKWRQSKSPCWKKGIALGIAI